MLFASEDAIIRHWWRIGVCFALLERFIPEMSASSIDQHRGNFLEVGIVCLQGSLREACGLEMSMALAGTGSCALVGKKPAAFAFGKIRPEKSGAQVIKSYRASSALGNSALERCQSWRSGGIGGQRFLYITLLHRLGGLVWIKKTAEYHKHSILNHRSISSYLRKCSCSECLRFIRIRDLKTNRYSTS